MLICGASTDDSESSGDDGTISALLARLRFLRAAVAPEARCLFCGVAAVAESRRSGATAVDGPYVNSGLSQNEEFAR